MPRQQWSVDDKVSRYRAALSRDLGTVREINHRSARKMRGMMTGSLNCNGQNLKRNLTAFS